MSSMPAFYPHLQVLIFSLEKEPPWTGFSWVFWSCPVPTAACVNSEPCAPLCDPASGAQLPQQVTYPSLSLHGLWRMEASWHGRVSSSWAHRETEALEQHYVGRQRTKPFVASIRLNKVCIDSSARRSLTWTFWPSISTRPLCFLLCFSSWAFCLHTVWGAPARSVILPCLSLHTVPLATPEASLGSSEIDLPHTHHSPQPVLAWDGCLMCLSPSTVCKRLWFCQLRLRQPLFTGLEPWHS